MNNSIISFPTPANEPVKAYLAGSPERVALEKELERQSNLVVDIPIIIGSDAHAPVDVHGNMEDALEYLPKSCYAKLSSTLLG